MTGRSRGSESNSVTAVLPTCRVGGAKGGLDCDLAGSHTKLGGDSSCGLESSAGQGVVKSSLNSRRHGTDHSVINGTVEVLCRMGGCGDGGSGSI